MHKSERTGSSVSDDKQGPSRAAIWRMFNLIAPRYDLLNHLLSWGQDVRWRRKLVENLPDRPGLCLLDLATGTGDALFALCCGKVHRVRCAVGLDRSCEMLQNARAKAIRRDRPEIAFLLGDALQIPLGGSSCDVVTMSFGIRNVTNVEGALGEALRVLKPGGRVLILETSLPDKPLWRAIYLLYLRHILPRVGGWISGNAPAYRYLNRTIETFPYGPAFCRMLAAAGFQDVRAISLTLGTATLYRGDKL